MKKFANTLEVFQKAMQGRDFSYDIYFRIAVIREYLNGNEKIWNLYQEMQEKRCGEIKEIPEEMVNHIDAFKELIDDFKDNGYDPIYPILVNKDGYIIDGAHRMACSLFFNVEEVVIMTNNQYYVFYPAEYTKEWFIKNGLEECIKFAEREKELLEKRYVQE